MVYTPWNIVDDGGYFPQPVCAECGNWLTRSYDDGTDSTPLEKDCPHCGAVLRLDN